MKLCDFGSASTVAQVYETDQEMAEMEEIIERTTTPTIRPPEMCDLLLRRRIDEKVDIWGLGCLLYALCFGTLPFTGEKLAILNVAYRQPEEYEQQYSEQLLHLLARTLSELPEDRPEAKELCEILEKMLDDLEGQLFDGSAEQQEQPTPQYHAEDAYEEANGMDIPAKEDNRDGTDTLPEAITKQSQGQSGEYHAFEDDVEDEEDDLR